MRPRCVIGIPAAVVIAMAALCPGASAAVIFNNISNGGNGFFGVTANSWEAQRFNSDATNPILTAAAFSLAASGDGQYRISLYSDVGNQPGVALGTLFNGTTLTKPASGANVQYGGLTQPLAPNTNYWIVLSVDAGQPTSFGWEATLTFTGTGAGFQTAAKTSSNQGATWVDRSAPHKMQLVADVPEPAAAGLTLLAAAGLLTRRRRVVADR